MFSVFVSSDLGGGGFPDQVQTGGGPRMGYPPRPGPDRERGHPQAKDVVPPSQVQTEGAPTLRMGYPPRQPGPHRRTLPGQGWGTPGQGWGTPQPGPHGIGGAPWPGMGYPSPS